jgi:Family of unknown function (DUF5675)
MAPFMVTLEHAYEQDDGSYAPKIPPGVYTCVLGTHSLSNGVPFQTYEITGVAGHSGLLFHTGNWDSDSSGCVLCGQTQIVEDGSDMITNSRITFNNFMARLGGVQTWQLKVI